MSQDTLSDVLRGVRLRGAVFFYVTGSSEWAAEAPSAKEIAPLLIVIRLSEFRYADATAIAVVMLVVAFLVIFVINRLQRWAQLRVPTH